MDWFFIALINPVAHAIANHFDKYMLSKYLKGTTVGTLILFSGLFAVVALPVIWAIEPSVLTSVALPQALLLIVNGAILVVAIMCYLYALEEDEASYVAPLFQLIPIFGLGFGFLILGETLTIPQLLAGTVILFGAMVLSVDMQPGKFRLKKKVLFFMLGSSLLYAVNAVLFKFVAVEQGFLASLFWDMLGKFLFGVALFFLVTPYRRQFLGMLRQNGLLPVGLNSVNEIISLIGEYGLVLATLYAPVALVQSVGAIQPMFVLLIGVILTLYFPKIAEESVSRRHLAQKGFGIIVVIIGAILLERA